MINEWKKLNFNIRTTSFNNERANLIKTIRPIAISIFVIFNPLELKLITRLWVGLSHLNKHRFNCIDPLCTCSLDVKSAVHFFLHCSYHNSAKTSLLNDFNNVDKTWLNLSDLSLVNIQLYCGPQFHDSQNAFILNSFIKYTLNSERFCTPLF